MRITTRLLTPDDFDTAEEIGQSAFGASATFGETIRTAQSAQPDGCFMASVDEEPVGTATIVDYGPFCYIGAMCVREEVQRRGIGRALLNRLLEWQEQKGIPIALLDATEAGACLYRQLGFQEIDEVIRYRPLTEADYSSLLELDRRIFGGNREAGFVFCQGARIGPWVARELLEEYGFEATIHTHMGLGTSRPVGERASVYGQSSFALG